MYSLHKFSMNLHKSTFAIETKKKCEWKLTNTEEKVEVLGVEKAEQISWLPICGIQHNHLILKACKQSKNVKHECFQKWMLYKIYVRKKNIFGYV